MFQFHARHAMLALACGTMLAGAAAGRASAQTQPQKWSHLSGTVKGVKITLFSAPENDTGIFRIATGSDGHLWFGESGANDIVKFTTTGEATSYQPIAGAKPEGLALGANGAIWFAEFTTSYIDSITPSGKIKRFPVAALNGGPSDSCGFVLGANGDIYFTTDFNGVGDITKGGKSSLISIGDNSAQPVGLGLGPDGNVWFIDVSGPYIGKITPKNVVTSYQSGIGGGANWGIVAGADGRMWYTNEAAHDVVAFDITTEAATAYPVTHTDGTAATPDMIVAGPDGNLYVGEATGYIDKVTTAGAVTAYPLPGNPGGNFVINGMTVGPDGNIWFANDIAAQVGVFTLTQ